MRLCLSPVFNRRSNKKNLFSSGIKLQSRVSLDLINHLRAALSKKLIEFQYQSKGKKLVCMLASMRC